MKRTNKYGLTYFEKGDFTSSLPEMQRWETLDNQLYALFNIIGNGIISGWDLIESSGLSIVVSNGSGHVSFVAVNSTNNVLLNLVSSSKNYIYASLTEDSYWTKNVNFSVSLYENLADNVLLLGTVTTNDTSIDTNGIDTSGRTYLGFIDLVNNAVKNHRHIGGTTNPSQINLATDVQGILGQENIDNLDASVIQTGTIDANRLPLISHISGLFDQGTLTHAQLDDFVNTLSIPNQQTMGEVSSINLLQLILGLKHIYPEIDDFMVNELAIIPGITPDSYIDLVNTTATVDLRTHAEGGTHTISGTQSTGIRAYSRIWDTEDDFNNTTRSNTIVIGDTVSLDAKENKLIIDEFNDITNWTIETKDLSSVPSFLTVDTSDYIIAPSSAKLSIQSKAIEIVLQIKRQFIAQDWSGYDYLKLFIKTDSVEHGDLYFYLNDNDFGIQNSYQIILNRNTPSINIDTLQNGWQEITIALDSFNRAKINEIGFYVSTQSGWDTSKGFSFNIDDIYLSSGNIYQTDGYCRFIYGSDFLYDFWRIRWDAIIPNDIDSYGVEFKVRTRVSNTISGLSLAVWSDYSSISGYELPIPVGEMYKYIEIESYFVASSNFKRSATLTKIYLDFYAADIDNSFEYNKKTDWDSGYKYNIDTNSVSNSMAIYGTDEIGDFIYGTEKNIYQTDGSFVEKYKIGGTTLPRSTYQILNDMPSAFGTITAVQNGNMGSLWICDTDNDRIIEIDKNGNALRGFFGSYLVENGTNASSNVTTTGDGSTIELLESIYNDTKGILYLIFNRDLSDIEVSSMANKFIKIGSSNFFLDNSKISKAMSGFDHVIKIQLDGANKTLLDYFINQPVPSISILNPYQYQKTLSSVDFKFMVYNFNIGITAGENTIRLTLDGGVPFDIFTTSYTFVGLSNGIHSIKAQLVNGNGDLNTNIEAIAEETFVVSPSNSVPYIKVLSPKSNQIFSSSPVQIDFAVDNFPIIPNGQHLKYSVDGGIAVDYYSTDPIIIDGISNGKHNLRIYLVDAAGNEIGYTYGNIVINFIVGTNSVIFPKVYINIGSKSVNSYVLISPLTFTDVYAPFDVQYIPFEISPINPSGKESILIGKLTNDYVLGKIRLK